MENKPERENRKEPLEDFNSYTKSKEFALNITDEKKVKYKINLGRKRIRNNNIEITSSSNKEKLVKERLNEVKDGINAKFNNVENLKKNDDENKCSYKLIINDEEKSTNISCYDKINQTINEKEIKKENYIFSFSSKCENKNSKDNDNIYNSLFFVVNLIEINDLNNDIIYLMDQFKIDMENMESYNKLHLENLNNKLVINRLSIMISFLQNSNLINLRRKIIEALFFELFLNNNDYFLLVNYKPNKSNIIELTNLINKKIEEKIGENKKEEYKSDLNRLIQITNQNEVKKINDRKDSYIKIIEKYNKKTRQINMVFEFLRFCKKTLNPYVHASGKTIEYYLLPKFCLDANYDSNKYMLTLDDILVSKFETNNNKNETFSQINVPEADIYKNKKILTINESLKILLSEKIVLSDLNKDFSDEIKKKRKHLNEETIILQQKFDYFSGIITKQNSSKEKIDNLKNEFLEPNQKFLEQLTLFDSIISNIFIAGAKLDEKMKKNIEIIKECFNNDICPKYDILENIMKMNLGPDEIKDYLNIKIYRLKKILNLLQGIKKKIIEKHKSLYKEYENDLNIITDKIKELFDLVNSKYNIMNECLFQQWLETHPKINHKYCKIEILRNNCLDLIKNIDLNINYSYDEKFLLWVIKNNFSQYIVN